MTTEVNDWLLLKRDQWSSGSMGDSTPFFYSLNMAIEEEILSDPTNVFISLTGCWRDRGGKDFPCRNCPNCCKYYLCTWTLMFLPYRGLNGSSPLHISRESHCLQIGGDPHQVLGWRGPKYGNTALIKCRVKTEDVVVLLLSLRPLCSVDWRNLKLAIRIRLMWTETAYFGRSDAPSVPSSVWRPPNSSPMANVWEMKDRTAGFQHSRFPLFSGEIGPTQRSQAVAHSPLLIHAQLAEHASLLGER